MRRVQDKVDLVTGGARGQGRTAKVLLPSKETGAVVSPVPDEGLRRRGAQVVSRMSGKVGEEMRRLHGE
jgi:hypothetical protein